MVNTDYIQRFNLQMGTFKKAATPTPPQLLNENSYLEDLLVAMVARKNTIVINTRKSSIISEI